jgi:hypothetical protein
MAVRSSSDAFAWLIARLPLLLIVALVAWIAIQGLTALERYSFGSEYFLSNAESENVLPMPKSDEQLALDAINSGDLATMESALAQIEERQAKRASVPAAVG